MSKPRPVVTRVPPAEPSPRSSAHIHPSKPAKGVTQIKEPKTEEPEGMCDLLHSLNLCEQDLKNILLLTVDLNL